MTEAIEIKVVDESPTGAPSGAARAAFDAEIAKRARGEEERSSIAAMERARGLADRDVRIRGEKQKELLRQEWVDFKKDPQNVISGLGPMAAGVGAVSAGSGGVGGALGSVAVGLTQKFAGIVGGPLGAAVAGFQVAGEVVSSVTERQMQRFEVETNAMFKRMSGDILGAEIDEAKQRLQERKEMFGFASRIGVWFTGEEKNIKQAERYQRATEAFHARAQQLAQYSGPLAEAKAQFDVGGMLRDIRMANVLGTDMARLVDMQNKQEEVKSKKAILEQMKNLKAQEANTENQTKNMEKQLENDIEQMALSKKFTADQIKFLMQQGRDSAVMKKALEAVAEDMAAIRKQLEQEQRQPMDDLLDGLEMPSLEELNLDKPEAPFAPKPMFTF